MWSIANRSSSLFCRRAASLKSGLPLRTSALRFPSPASSPLISPLRSFHSAPILRSSAPSGPAQPTPNVQQDQQQDQQGQQQQQQQQQQQKQHTRSQRERYSRERYAHEHAKQRQRHVNQAIYLGSTIVLVLGLSYASVPLYRMFCAVTGYGGTVQEAGEDKLSQLLEWRKKNDVTMQRELSVTFNADVDPKLNWRFAPCQNEIKLHVGETALAFFNAENMSDQAITGVATYNVTPMKAGKYFNKVQCFCFDEQRLRPGENLDMPVWFFLDPEFASDPRMEDVRDLVLSYTFYQVEVDDDEEEDEDDEPTSEGMICPMPDADVVTASRLSNPHASSSAQTAQEICPLPPADVVTASRLANPHAASTPSHNDQDHSPPASLPSRMSRAELKALAAQHGHKSSPPPQQQ